MEIQEVSVFRGIQEVSARRLRKELINRNLYLFSWPFKVDYGWPFLNDAKFKKYIFKLNKIYLHSRHYFTFSNCVYLCSFKELYLFNFKEMIYFLTVKKILILSNNICLFTKSIIIRGNYILTRNYIHFKEPYQFVQGKISSFNEIYSLREIISIQGSIFIYGTYIRSSSRPYVFIQGNYIYWTLLHSRNSRNIYSKIVPSHFMIIISFK